MTGAANALAPPAARARKLGASSVPPLGLGCMNLSHAYAPPPPAQEAAKLLLHALERGVTHFDTAALYGFGANEELLGRVLSAHRSRITLASKCGMHGVTADGRVKRVIDGRPETLKQNCTQSLRRLRTDVIDLYYLHRWDKQVPIEESVGALADLRREGKIQAIGLSEVSAATLRRAHAVHPIAAVQSEYSLATRNPEIAVLAACREIGATFVAFSPLSRGYLTGALRDVAHFADKDIRRTMPRFESANYAANLRLLDEYGRLAAQAGCTMSQLALAWVLARGEHVVAIPGTTRIDHLDENLGAYGASVGADLIARLDVLFAPNALTGNRYGVTTQAEIDAETFPAESA